MLSMVASVSMPHSLHSNTRHTHEHRNFMKTTLVMSIRCHNQDEAEDPADPDRRKLDMKMDKASPAPAWRILDGVGKLGSGLKDRLSPQRKGDWKDLTLMSLSFAVYVYMSQKIVCAYCAWMSMSNQPW